MKGRNSMYENDKLREIIKTLKKEQNIHIKANKEQEACIKKQDNRIKYLELLLDSRISKYVRNYKEIEKSKYSSNT